MTIAAIAENDQVCTVSTEHTLDTITTPGVLVLVADLATLAANDIFELRIYGKARATGTERLMHRATYGPTVLAAPLVFSIPIVSPHHFRATIKQTAGTSRTIPWAIYST